LAAHGDELHLPFLLPVHQFLPLPTLEMLAGSVRLG
jgi:hypothetical protein